MIVAYEAVNAEGHHTRDAIEAVNVTAAVGQLRQQGLYVISARPRSARRAAASAVANRSIGRAPGSALEMRHSGESNPRLPRRAGSPARIPLGSLVVFTRQMAMMLHAGSAVVPALTAVAKQARNPRIAAVIHGLIHDVQNGLSFSEALRQHPTTFDPVYCAVVAAGEASASLGQSFERLAGIVGKRRAMRNKVLAALTYPALLVCMCCGILSALLFLVIPRFSTIFTELNVQPPLTTKMMLAAGATLSDHWPIVIGLVVAVLAGLVVGLTGARGRQWLNDVQVDLPGIGRLRRRLIQAEVFRTIGMLLEAGVGLLDTLELARRSTSNARFQVLFNDLEEAVTSGRRLSSAFEASGLVEPYVCQAVHTGEDSGKLGGAMSYCADTLDETNTELIGTLMRLLEPIILLGMGLVVGAAAVCLFLPLFDLTSALR